MDDDIALKDILQKWRQAFEANPDILAGIDGVFKWVITGEGGGKWMLNPAQEGGIYQGDDEADCEISLAAGDFVDLVQGKLNPQQAFLEGRIRLAGNMQLALQLDGVLRQLSSIG